MNPIEDGGSADRVGSGLRGVPERDAFIAAIQAEPGSNQSALIFADWLEEHGDWACAELIRLHAEREAIEARGMGTAIGGDGLAWRQLLRRERALLDSIGPRLHGAIYSPTREDGWVWPDETEGGLMRQVALTDPERFVRRPPWRVAHEPVRSLVLCPPAWPWARPLYPEDIERLGGLPEAAFLDAIAIRQIQVLPGAVAALGRDGRFPRLRRLDLEPAADCGLHAAVGAPGFSGLAELRVAGFARRRTNLPHLREFLLGLPRLTHLTLERIGNATELRRWFGDEASDEAHPPRSAWSLRTLTLRDLVLGDDGAAWLADRENLADLEGLRLSQARIGDAGLASLSRGRSVAGLRVLRLDGNRIGDLGVKALTRSSCLDTLDLLDLTDNQITAAGAEMLAEAVAGRQRPIRIVLIANPIPRPARLALANRPITAAPAEIVA